MELNNLTRHLRHLLRDILGEVDINLGQTFDAIAAYMAEQALALSSITDELDFDGKLRIVRDDVALFAGLKADDLEDRHLIGAIQGALAIGARSIGP